MYKTEMHEICVSQNFVWHTKTYLKKRTVVGKTECMGTLLICHIFGVPPPGICKCITTASQFKPDKQQH